jgi:beta-carotene 3-hydroxylase
MTFFVVTACVLIAIATFFFMEFVAWFTHKYVMHGLLWTWHRSHHKKHSHTLEKNDLFALVFSIPSILLLVYFIENFNPYMIAVGVGIMAYGIFYMVFHDIIVHQRIKWRPKKRSKYLNRMINAHYVHHEKHTKEDCEAFGFLYAPKKYKKYKEKQPQEA